MISAFASEIRTVRGTGVMTEEIGRMFRSLVAIVVRNNANRVRNAEDLPAIGMLACCEAIEKARVSQSGYELWAYFSEVAKNAIVNAIISDRRHSNKLRKFWDESNG